MFLLARKQPRVSDLCEGKRKARLGTRVRDELSRRANARANLISSDEREHVEQTRTYRSSRNCDANGVYQRSGLHITRLSRYPQRRFSRRRIERREIGEGRVERL